MSVFVEIIGWVGAAAILAGYFLFSIGKLRNGYGYQSFNLVGAAGLLINALVNQSWPFVILNAVWSATAIYALVRLATRGRATQGEDDASTSADATPTI